MGKRLIVQRRGTGSPVFKAASHKRVASVKYRKITKDEYKTSVSAEIIDLFHEPGRGAPLGKLRFEDGYQTVFLPAEGLAIGDTIKYGITAELKEGNVLPLEAVPIRTPIFNIEVRKGDGGKLVRSSGGSAVVDSKTEKFVIVELPSGKFKKFPLTVRASIGVVAGGGRVTKPFLKAGNMYHHKKAKGQKYPRVSGVAMNAVKHPHGGGAHQSPHQPTTVGRNSPPGRKVGLISARRTGSKQGRQTSKDDKDKKIQ